MSNCPLYNEDCEKEQHQECQNLVQKYSKIIWCKDFKCSWNLEIEQSKTIKHHRDYVALGKTDGYRGICSRPEIGLSHKIFETGTRANGVRHEVAACDFRSNKSISGHMDWSRFADQKQSSNVSDPIEFFPSDSNLSDTEAM